MRPRRRYPIRQPIPRAHYGRLSVPPRAPRARIYDLRVERARRQQRFRRRVDRAAWIAFLCLIAAAIALNIVLILGIQ